MENKFKLSPDAELAISWLFSEQSKGLTNAEARAAILKKFGSAVDEELYVNFGKKTESHYE